jgi:opacity protein-like surface antigen
MNLGSAVGPNFYVQGGAGLYKVSWKYDYQDEAANVIVGDDSYSKLGFNVGAGVGFPVGPKTRMNISTSYHVVPVDENVETVADNLNNIQVRAGIGFNL